MLTAGQEEVTVRVLRPFLQEEQQRRATPHPELGTAITVVTGLIILAVVQVVQVVQVETATPQTTPLAPEATAAAHAQAILTEHNIAAVAVAAKMAIFR